MNRSELDITELVCPKTVITVLQRLKDLDDGDTLEVTTISETAIRSIPAEVSKKSYSCEVAEIERSRRKQRLGERHDRDGDDGQSPGDEAASFSGRGLHYVIMAQHARGWPYNACRCDWF